MPKSARRAKRWMAPESGFYQWNLDVPSLFIARIAKSPCVVSVPAGRLPMNHHLPVRCGDLGPLERAEKVLASEEARMDGKAGSSIGERLLCAYAEDFARAPHVRNG